MASIYDVPPNDLIGRAAIELAKLPEISPPEWSKFCKTGHSRERPPARDDWWYVRTAAVLMTVWKKGPIGVQKLRTKYGSRKQRGHKPAHFYRSGGNVLRKVLQQLEAAQLVKQAAVGLHKGRVITPKGKGLLDKLATELAGPKAEKPKRIVRLPSYKKPEKAEEGEKPKKARAPRKRKEAVPEGAEVPAEAPVEAPAEAPEQPAEPAEQPTETDQPEEGPEQ